MEFFSREKQTGGPTGKSQEALGSWPPETD
jgi:hypothetical protein